MHARGVGKVQEKGLRERTERKVSLCEGGGKGTQNGIFHVRNS